MTDTSAPIRRMFTGAGVRVISLVVSGVIGFFMTPFLIGQLGDQLFGIWVLASSFGATYSLLDLGLSGSIGRFVALHLGKGDLKAVNRYFNTAIILYMAMGFGVLLIAGGVTLFASRFVETPENASLLSIVIMISAANFAIMFPIRAIIGSVKAKIRLDVTASLSLIFKLLSTFLTVVVVLAGGKIIAIALVMLGLTLIRIVIWYFTLRRVMPEAHLSPSYFSRKTLGSLLSFSMIAFVAQIANLLRFRTDNFVIGGFMKEGAITHYTVGITLTSYMSLLVTTCLNVLAPYFAQQFGREDHEGMIRTLYFGFRVATVLALFIAFGLILWGNPFITRWMGTDYLDAYACVVVIAIGLIPELIQIPANSAMMGMAKHHFFAVANSIEAIANLICSIILVQYYGIFGVALGTFLPMIVIKSTLQPWFVAKVLEIPIWQYYGRIFLMIFKCLVALVPAAILSYYLVRPTYFSLFLTGALSAVTYFPIVVLMMFPRQERDKIFQAIFKRSSPEG